jgi:molybdopterin/thiamine biosynthesis adenylyltransferase
MAGRKWNGQYRDLVQRNLGLLSEEEQNRLKKSTVCIFGIGGLGGIILEILTRSGIERFRIVDNDNYDTSNRNRQIFAFEDNAGQKKIEVAAQFCRRINPDIQIETFDHIGEDNCAQILEGADVGVLVLDDVKACLNIARTARRMQVILVEGWALPFANVCTFTPQSASFEQTYGLAEIENVPVSQISEKQNWMLMLKILLRFGSVEGVADYFTDETLKNLADGRVPSWAPMVWFNATRIAVEVTKVLLKWGDLALSPDFAIYDPFCHRIPQILESLPAERESTVKRIFHQ